MSSFVTKSTPVHKLHFTRKNLLIGSGPFVNLTWKHVIPVMTKDCSCEVQVDPKRWYVNQRRGKKMYGENLGHLNDWAQRKRKYEEAHGKSKIKGMYTSTRQYVGKLKECSRENHKNGLDWNESKGISIQLSEQRGLNYTPFPVLPTSCKSSLNYIILWKTFVYKANKKSESFNWTIRMTFRL